MGWFWDLKPSAPEDTNTDPLRDLDPSLADFLSKESPPSYSTSAPPPSLPPPPPPPAPPEPASSAPPSSTSSSTSSSSSTSQLAPPPPPTLYPDGRFAHLWANYRPLSEVEWAVKTDQERLADVLEDYKERKASIARAALENCTLEQDSVNECFTRGPWTKRVTMCREENKAFERCYLMQSRFLKALGYLSSNNRSGLDEKIQMHADTLFHRMLDQEAAIANAKATSSPIPTFPPILSSSSSSSSSFSPQEPSPLSPPPPPSSDPLTTTTTTRDFLTPEARAALNARLQEMPPEERELEEIAVTMQVKRDAEIGRQVNEIRNEQQRKRKERREKGEASVGDTISGWLGW